MDLVLVLPPFLSIQTQGRGQVKVSKQGAKGAKVAIANTSR